MIWNAPECQIVRNWFLKNSLRTNVLLSEIMFRDDFDDFIVGLWLLRKAGVMGREETLDDDVAYKIMGDFRCSPRSPS